MKTSRSFRAPQVIIVLILGALGAGALSLGIAWAAPTQALPAAVRVELVIDGYPIADFSRCVLSSETSDIAAAAPVRRVTCERALTADLALAAWRDTAEAGPAAKDASLTMFAPSGEPVAAWNLGDAYPAGLTTYFDEGGVGREIVTFAAASLQRMETSG